MLFAPAFHESEFLVRRVVLAANREFVNSHPNTEVLGEFDGFWIHLFGRIDESRDKFVRIFRLCAAGNIDYALEDTFAETIFTVFCDDGLSCWALAEVLLAVVVRVNHELVSHPAWPTFCASEWIWFVREICIDKFPPEVLCRLA